MSNRQEIGRQGLRKALEIRRRLSVSRSEPVCVYDIADRLGVEVIFCAENSLGGMYVKTSQTILLPARRPPGRRAYSCAHELGHWAFGHGTRLDEMADIAEIYGPDECKSDERLANTFASSLLMPPWAVNEAFARRNWKSHDCTALQIYTVAGQLGVGYETLVKHLNYSLKQISDAQTERLLKSTPRQIRHSLVSSNPAPHLVIVDRAWISVAVDLEVGELAILPEDVSLEGQSVSVIDHHSLGLLVEGRIPGITRGETQDGSWASFIRVSRKDFIGRSIYRHLEDPDVDEMPATI